jgi:PAS domain S-box-containing protein
MQTAYKRLSVIAGFLTLLALLFVNALITYRELTFQVQSQAQVAHSRDVLYELSQTESLLKDSETGQRGYLYTGDLKYLTPYNSAIGEVPLHIDRLAQLTADDPTQQKLVAELRVQAQNKAAELQQSIALFKAGKFEDAKAVVLSDAGLLSMDHIRLIVVEMQREETNLETARLDRYRKSIGGTFKSIYLTTALAAIGLALLAYYILHQIRLREDYAKDMRGREEWFRVTLTCIGDGVIATDAAGRVTFMNPIAESLTGSKLADVTGKIIYDVFPIAHEQTGMPAANPVDEVLTTGRIVAMANHTVLKHVDGRLIPIEDSAAPIRDDRQNLLGVVLVFRDATYERKSEEILRKTEKLASAARLSATVAHEINNPLEAIFNLVFVAKSDPAAPPSIVKHLTRAEQELERVAHITRQTLGFYRDTSVSEPVDMAAVVESVLSLYSHKFLAKEISVDLSLDSCPPVHGLAGELKQAVANLISNAADAVSVKGLITIRLRALPQPSGPIVELVIEDDGPGIPAAHTTRIFEPFFTTKQDVGTGLGLWVTQGIVHRHGGTISVDTQQDGSPRRGATFTLQLPIRIVSEAAVTHSAND